MAPDAPIGSAMLQDIVTFQREIYLSLAHQLSAFANGGGWGPLMAFLPMGIMFGAVHALMPGHGKAVLATYLTGSTAGAARGLLASLALSFTHVAMAVLISLLALPLVSGTLGSVGRAPALEIVSRGLLGVLGLWMLLRAWRGSAGHHDRREGIGVGCVAGLVPCPLTLFVMTFAMAKGAPLAGVAFAIVMMVGVGSTLAVVALAAVLFRSRLLALLAGNARRLARVTRVIEAASGSILVLVALRALLR